MSASTVLAYKRVERGVVVFARSGRGIVVQRCEDMAVIVWINKGPIPAHRADLSLSRRDMAHIGLQYDDVIRCVPFIMRVKYLHSLNMSVSFQILRCIEAKINREILTRRGEDNCRQMTGGPSLPRNGIYSQ